MGLCGLLDAQRTLRQLSEEAEVAEWCLGPLGTVKGVGFFRAVWIDAGFIWVFFFLGFCGFGVGFFRVVWVDAGFIWVFFF